VIRLGRQLPLPGSRFAFANGARAFRHRNYRLFFSGQLVSLIGTWMQSVAQSWLVLQLSGDPFLLGLVAAVQFVPVLVLGLFGGLIADVLPKRKTLIVTQAIQMMLAFVLFGLAASGIVEVWHIIVLAALLGITNAVDMPTRQAFAVEMVGREDVANAVALNSATFNAARILGPAIAGLTIGAFDISIAFLLNGLSFMAVIVAYSVMRDDELHSPPLILRPRSVGEVRTTLAEGLRYVWATPLVLLATAVIGLASTFGMNFNVIIPALAQDVLRTDAAGYGFLMAASGIGALVAALTIAFSRRSRPGLIAGGAALLGVAEIALALSGSFGVSLVLMFVVGLGAILMAATANTTIQLTVPDQLRGRTMSVYTTVFAGSTPFGGLLMGWIASRFGVDVSIAVGGIACAVIGVGAFAWLRRIRGRQDAASLGAAEAEAGGVPVPARPR
jgi:MFS family permease